MYSVLMNAVLSTSPDHGLLLDALSWPGDSWPGTERLEALTAFIEALVPLMNDSDTTQLTDAKRRSIQEKIHSVIWTLCLPLLSRISAGEGMQRRESTAAACRLVSACVRLCDETVPGRLVLSVLPSLQLSEEEPSGPGRLSAEVACEVMAALIPSLSASEQLTLMTSALSGIKTVPDALVSKITARLLLPLTNCSSSSAGSESILQLILSDLCDWHSSNRTSVVTERTLLCLTAVSDHLLTAPAHSFPSTCDPRLSVQFWRMVQDGLTHRDSVSRKRALYLLRKCLVLSEEEGVDCPLSPTLEGKNAQVA